MRKIFCLLFVLLYAAASLADAGIMPKRGRRKKRNDSGFIGAARLTLGPKYSKPDDPPPPGQIPGIIRDSDPNSPNQIAAQSMGLASGGNCQALQARAQALIAQLNAITAELLAEEQAILGCGGGIAGANCAIAHGNAAIALGNQAIPIATELQSLQGQAASCGGSSSGQAALPPGVTLGAVAKRFNIRIPDAPGGASGGGAMGASPALEQLKELASQGEGADFDGRGGNSKLGKAINRYSAAIRRAAVVGPRVRAGRELAGRKESFDDPTDRAQAEYLKINYKELGPKYEALVQERHAAAENVADQALSGLGPNAPLMDAGMPSMIQIDDSKATALEGPGLNAATAWDSTKEGMKDALVEKLPLQWQSLEKIAEIDLAVAKAWDLRDDLMEAVNEMGSGSGSTVATEKMLAKLDQYFGDVKDATFEKNPFKSLLGSN
jgi:hypothetical protein